MLYSMAIETGDSVHAYGVVFPDLAGCYSAGDSLEEAITNAKCAVELYLEDFSERGKLPPFPSDLSELQKDEKYAGWTWAVIDIDVEEYMGKSEKKNVTLPSLLYKKFDDQIGLHLERYKNSSPFLPVAA